MSNHPQKSGSLCSGMSGSLCSGIGGSLYGSSSLLVNTLILLSSYSISITPISMKIPVKISRFLIIPIFLIKTN